MIKNSYKKGNIIQTGGAWKCKNSNCEFPYNDDDEQTCIICDEEKAKEVEAVDKEQMKKILTGLVVSDKPNKTITVVVERKYSHPVLKKVVKVRKKYNAHDENNKFKTGDKVSIIESKPFSKNKKFQVMDGSK